MNDKIFVNNIPEIIDFPSYNLSYTINRSGTAINRLLDIFQEIFFILVIRCE